MTKKSSGSGWDPIFDLVGEILLGIGKWVLVAGTALGALIMGGIWGVSKLTGSGDTTVGVTLTKEQQTLRKNGALCDAYLTEAFAQSLRENKVVELKLPANPAQNCPKL